MAYSLLHSHLHEEGADVSTLQQLLAATAADVKERWFSGGRHDDPIFCACFSNESDILRALLSDDVCAAHVLSAAEECTNLHMAAWTQSTCGFGPPLADTHRAECCIELLLDAVAALRTPRDVVEAWLNARMEGQTALHTAASCFDAPAMWRLLHAGADPTLRDSAGLTAAALYGQEGEEEEGGRLARAQARYEHGEVTWWHRCFAMA